MSIHRTNAGTWRVRYRVAGKLRSRNFDRKGDAERFDNEMTRRRQLGGQLAAEVFDRRGDMSLAAYVNGPWRSHAVTLSRSSRDKYRWALGHLGALVDEPLAALDVHALAEYQRAMLEKG